MLPKTVAKITEPDTEETRRHAKPKVRLMGNIHGNEDQVFTKWNKPFSINSIDHFRESSFFCH